MSHAREPSPELDALARETIGAAIEVHRALGPGFLESIYQEALCLELTHRSISFARQVPIAICYRSCPIGASQLDLMVAGQLVVELGAVPQILPIHVAQVISYLKAARKPLGLLLNFHVPVLQAGIKRVIVSDKHNDARAQGGNAPRRSPSKAALFPTSPWVRIVGAGPPGAHQGAHQDHERPDPPRRQSGR